MSVCAAFQYRPPPYRPFRFSIPASLMSDSRPGSVSLASDDSQIVPQLTAGSFPARLRFILHVVECCLSSHVTDHLIFRVFTKLFLGIDDIWMWIGGDERRCSGLKLGDRSMQRCHLLPRLMAWSLRHDNWNIHCLRNHTVSNEVVFDHQRLDEASFRMRLCMVSWSIITSRVVQDARTELGFSDWRRWEHFSAINAFEESMEEALLGMESEIEAGFPFTVPELVRAANFEDEFGCSLQRDGHTSHFQPRGNWNTLQAFLYPEKTDKDWRMIHFSQHLDSICPRCMDLYVTSSLC
ncbi:hypothetical protein BDZ89DRAFT_146238 [Hymenopellis radicata]|nr:hypothetical protein BDZ89DRAFT_146238 [Hymenopellis radicata]